MRNKAVRSELKTAVKRVRAAVEANDAELAQAEAKLEEARRLKAEAEAAMNATKQEGTDGE